MTMRYAEVSQKGLKFLDFTSLTVEEFEQLVPVFEENYQKRMKYVRLDGKPRTGREYQTYSNCPLPTPEDRLLFILVYLKTNNLQVVQGELFGMPQNKANQWIHTLLPVLQTTMRDLGETPARSLAELAQRLDQSVLSDLTTFTPDTSDKVSDGRSPTSDEMKREKHEDASPPLFAMTGPNDVSSVRKTKMNRKTIIAG
jgi:Helix-turn-helix of DDE superfamily endonuclease